ncbi:MAG: thioredoxin, partial [Oscillospiraceae bacterium]
VLTITNENFEKEVMEAQDIVLIDFWASWCGPCRIVSPIIDEIGNELEKQNSTKKVGKINVDDQPDLASRFGIMSIPTLIAIKNGEIVSKQVGAISKDGILAMLND